MPTLVLGRLVEWSHEHGWGVLASPSTPGGCWFHYTSLTNLPEESLQVGEVYSFKYEQVEQDGYSYRASMVGSSDTSSDSTESDRQRLSGASFRSDLHLEFDQPEPDM